MNSSNRYPVERNAFDERLHVFTTQLNKMWHEQVNSPDGNKLVLAAIHERMKLFKERFPASIDFSDLDEDLLGLVLQQVRDRHHLV
jgi:hypothetical protein